VPARPPSRQRHLGFTLVEIMVVVSIIAIIVGLAAVSVGGQAEREFNNQVEKLYHKIRLVADQAELAGIEVGIAFDSENNYYFLQYDEQSMGWASVDAGTGIFKPDTLDENILLNLKQEDEEAIDLSILYKQEEEKEDEVKDYGEEIIIEPDIVFFSDGQLTPFTLEIESRRVEDVTYLLTGESLMGVNLAKKQ